MFNNSKPAPKFCKKCGEPILHKAYVEECDSQTGKATKIRHTYWCTPLWKAFYEKDSVTAMFVIMSGHTNEDIIEEIKKPTNKWW